MIKTHESAGNNKYSPLPPRISQQPKRRNPKSTRMASTKDGSTKRSTLIKLDQNDSKRGSHSPNTIPNNLSSVETHQWVNRLSSRNQESRRTSKGNRNLNLLNFGLEEPPDRYHVNSHPASSLETAEDGGVDGSGEYKYSAYYIERLTRRHEAQLTEKERSIRFLKEEIVDKDNKIYELKGRLAETEKSNNNLKESTREVLDDFSQLKQLVLLTMEEICGKIKEKEKKVVKVKKKYKKLADHYMNEKAELLSMLETMRLKAGIIKSHVEHVNSRSRSRGSRSRKRNLAAKKPSETRPFY